MAPSPPRDPASELLPELLRAVIDNLPISIYTKDLQGRYVLNNVRNLRLLGVATEAEVRGKTVFDFFPPEIAGPYADDDRRVLHDGLVVQREEPFVDPVTGRSGWFHTTKIPLRLPRRQRHRRPRRRQPRHHRAEARRAAGPAGAAARVARRALGRRRARLQQPAHGHPRRALGAAAEPRRGRGAARSHRDRGGPRRPPHPPAPDVLAQAGGAAAGGRSRASSCRRSARCCRA